MKTLKRVNPAKLLATILTLCMTVALFSTNAFAADSTLTKDSQGRYVISNQDDLEKVANDLTADYILNDNITLTGNWTPLGWTDTADVPFTGTFNGNGYTISGFSSAYGSGATYVGLFAINKGTIENLAISVDEIFGDEYVGAVAGQNQAGGVISNITVTQTATIDGYTGISAQGVKTSGAYYSKVGGIAGDNLGTIQHCSVKAQVVGYYYTGGITGHNESTGKVEECRFLGGINSSTGISDLQLSAYVGGLVGMNDGSLKNSFVYAAASVKGGSCTGGAVGGNATTGTIYYVYSDIETVYSTDTTSSGIFCGYNRNTSGTVQSFVVAFSGQTNGTQNGATRISESTLKNSSTFKAKATQWDWTNVWKTGSTGLPLLVNCGVSTTEEITIPTAHEHVASDIWTTTSTVHYHKCVGENCDDTSVHLDEAAHIWSEKWYSNAAGTLHFHKCTVCERAASSSERYDHTWENGVCTGCGYECTHVNGLNDESYLVDGVCSNCGLDTNPKHEHTASSTLASDADGHWTVCESDGEAMTASEGHTYTYVINEDGTHSEKCSVCGYVKADSTANHSYTYVNNDGTHTGTCACGAEITVEHTYDDATGNCVCGAHSHVKSGDAQNGGTQHYWSCVADDGYKFEEDHTYEDHKCAVCGAEEPYKTVTYAAGTLLKNMDSVKIDDSLSEPINVYDGKYTPAAAEMVSYQGSWVYIFAGWKDEDGNTYVAGQETELEGDIVLTPIWKLRTINGDGSWDIDDALTIMQYVQDKDNNPLTAEQIALIGAYTGNTEPATYDIDTALAIMQKIQNKELVNN